jgi:hypothetical protein
VVHAVLGRRRPSPAGGLPAAWTSALDRFARGVHRFHDRVEVVPDRQLRGDLLEAGARLEAALVAVRSQARASRAVARRPGPATTVRGLLRSGTLCAHATECAMAAAAASRHRDAAAAARHLQEVRAAVDAVAALVGELDTTG